MYILIYLEFLFVKKGSSENTHSLAGEVFLYF